jgi:hypothetical protein
MAVIVPPVGAAPKSGGVTEKILILQVGRASKTGKKGKKAEVFGIEVGREDEEAPLDHKGHKAEHKGHKADRK